MVATAETTSTPDSRHRFLRTGLRNFRAASLVEKSVSSAQSVVPESTVPPVPMSIAHKPRSGLSLGGDNSLLSVEQNIALPHSSNSQLLDSNSMRSIDAAGNMVTAEPAAGTVTLTYNADQQRAAKQSTDGSVTGFLYDYKRLLCETDTIGGAISQTYASDTTEEFGDLIGEDGEYIHQYDAQANTNALLDNTGAVSAQYKYFAFGQVSSVSIEGGSWTAEDWESLPLDFTSNMMAGGKKQY